MTEPQILQAIADLKAEQKTQMNHILACEALSVALLHRMAPAALPAVAEEYAAALDRLAGQLSPDHQLPAVWAVWTAALAELQQFHAGGQKPFVG